MGVPPILPNGPVDTGKSLAAGIATVGYDG